MKKIMVILVTAVFMVLSACGSNKNVDESLMGNYIPVTGEMMGIALVGDDLDGFSIELKQGGKGTMTIEGDSGSVKWKNDDSTVTVTVDGASMVATRGQDFLVFDDILGMGMKMTFAKEGTEAANPELYLPETDKFVLGSWQSVSVTNILGDPVDTSEMKPDAFSMEARGDHTADITVEGKTFKGLKWSNMNKYGSIESDDVKVTWDVEEDGLSVDYVKNGEYYTFFCPKDSAGLASGSKSEGDSAGSEVAEAGNKSENTETAEANTTTESSETAEATTATESGETAEADTTSEGSKVAGAARASEESESADDLGLGATDITGGTENAEAVADYDFDEALKLVGDYEGFMVFKNGANCYGRNFEGITGDAYARIVIDENKKPLVYIRHTYGESINIDHVKGEFRDDGWLTVTGMMGTDDGPVEWMSIITPPVGNEPLCVSAVLTKDYETPLFDFYMKPLGSSWDYSYLDDVITEKDFNVYTHNMAAVNTGLLEDDLQAMQDFWSQNSKMDDPIKMITDELPDPELLHLYK